MINVGRGRPNAVLVDLPASLDADRLRRSLGQLGYVIAELEILCAQFGGAAARNRRQLAAGRGATGKSLASIEMPPARRVALGIRHRPRRGARARSSVTITSLTPTPLCEFVRPFPPLSRGVIDV